ncbi:hypothetical protein D3C84_937940 [compost metagenome]
MLAILQRLGVGLQGLELVFQRLPAVEVSVLVVEPLGGGDQQRCELVHQLRGASLQRVERIVEGIDHR